MLPLVLALSGCAWKLGPPAVSYAEDVATLPLVTPSTDSRRWYVPLDAGPKGQWLVFVDTGYSYTTCDDDFAKALGIDTRGERQVRGELGMISTSKAQLPPFTLGDHQIEGLVCLVRDLDSTSSISDPPEIPVAAVLGIDALRPFRVELDPAAGVLRLTDPADADALPKGPHTVRMQREYGFGTRVRIPLLLEGIEARPILDTGASNTYVDGERLGLIPTRTDENVRVRGSGPGGESRTNRTYYDVDDIVFAGHEIDSLTLTGRPRPKGTPGLLGLDVLGDYTLILDFRTGQAQVIPVDSPAVLPTWESWEPTGEITVRVPQR